MEKLTVIVKSRSGLHARPATLIVNEVRKFSSDITIQKEDRTVNGKSIMGILSIAAQNGDQLEIMAEGEDEAEAIYALRELFETTLVHA